MVQSIKLLDQIEERRPSEHLALRMLRFVNLTPQAKRKKLSTEISIDPITNAFVYKKTSSGWDKINCKWKTKLQKTIVTWWSNFSPYEEQIFRIIFVKAPRFESCLLTPGKCGMQVTFEPTTAFVCYPSISRYFQ